MEDPSECNELADIETHCLAQGDILVRVGSMENATSFWVCQVPAEPNTFQTARMRELLDLEKKMSARLNFEVSKFEKVVEPVIKETVCEKTLLRPKDFVAVRKAKSCEHWFRGQVLSVLNTPEGDLSTVRLIDYGDILKELEVSSCVRSMLPSDYSQVKPLAFRLHIADVIPLPNELSAHYHNLQEPERLTWSFEACHKIKCLIESTPGRQARVCNWMHSFLKNTIYGHVHLLHSESTINVSNYLIQNELGLEAFGSDFCLYLEEDAFQPSLIDSSHNEKKVLEFSRPKPFADDICMIEPVKESQEEQFQGPVCNLLTRKPYLFLPAGIDRGKDMEERQKRSKKSNPK